VSSKTITNATCIPSHQNILEYKKTLEKYKLLTDPGFQSSAEDSRWLEKAHSEYFLSLVTGKAPTPFIFADVNECLENAIDSEQSKDIEYYKEWKAKSSKPVLLNIDSFNRNFGFQKIMKGEVNLPHLKIEIKGLGSWDINELNDTYLNMPKSLINHFEKQYVWIQTYIDASREDLSDIFERVNSGKELSRPAKRNSKTTNAAKEVRDITNTFRKFFTADGCKWWTPEKQKTRYPDSFVADLVAILHYDWKKKTLNEDLKDSMYSYDNEGDINKKLAKYVTKIKSFLNMLTSDYYVFESKAIITTLFILWKEATDENYLVDKEKEKEMFDDFTKVIAKLKKDKDTMYTMKLGTAKDFSTISSGVQLQNLIKVNELLEEHGFDITKYMTKTNSTRVATNEQKFIAAVDQDFKTPNGSEIIKSKLHTGEFHKGHNHTAHRHGGSTEQDNLVVETSKENWKHGTKPV
jgi:hypothetical protein